MSDSEGPRLAPLRQYFGHASFRAGQRDLLEAVRGHLGLPAEVPAAWPARPPPMPFEAFNHDIGDDIAVP